MDITILGAQVPIEQYVIGLEITSLVLFFLLVFFYTAAGKWMIAYGKARLSGGKVAIEFDRTKEFVPFNVKIPKDWRSVFELPNKRGIIGIRRESIGHSNKIQTMLFSSEFEYTVSPNEIKGKRYFFIDPKEEDMMFYGYIDEKGNLVKVSNMDMLNKKYENTKVGQWVRYPDHTITPEEFVKYQLINADPLLTEGYAQHKENALRERINNPMSIFMGQYGWIIIIAIIAAGLAYQMISNNNFGLSKAGELQSCKDQIISMYNTGQCKTFATNLTNITGGYNPYPLGGGVR